MVLSCLLVHLALSLLLVAMDGSSEEAVLTEHLAQLFASLFRADPLQQAKWTRQ